MKIDWKQKFSSRKFWAMLGGQLTSILTAFNASESIILQMSAIIGSLGMFAVYMLAEAKVDAKRETEPLSSNFTGTISETNSISYFPVDAADDDVATVEGDD